MGFDVKHETRIEHTGPTTKVSVFFSRPIRGRGHENGSTRAIRNGRGSGRVNAGKLGKVRKVSRQGKGMIKGKRRMNGSGSMNDRGTLESGMRRCSRRPSNLGCTSNSDYHEGLLTSTSGSPYPVGADSAKERVDAARARTVSVM
jgi:hypothetical protein